MAATKPRRRRVAVTGASGFIGGHLVSHLEAHGDNVVRLVRGVPEPRRNEVAWDPARGRLDPSPLEGVDWVIHLAGEPIGRRWTRRRKRRILTSRRDGTALVASTVAGLRNPPSLLLCASATGYYGDRGDEILTEASPPGAGFLADVCRAWEAAADPAREAGIRVVHTRQGIVLGREGGALPRMTLPFRFGLGGRLGDGHQWMSWITADDLLGVYEHAWTRRSLDGPVNAVAPQPVTNAAFTRTLAHVLGRPAPFKVPRAALKAAYGEMAERALLDGARVRPAKLEASGYGFAHPFLDGALRHVLGREAPPAEKTIA